MKIGIISDTHDLLRPEVLAELQGSDYILHGGDISSRKILEKLEEIAPVKVVRGNNDKDWAEQLPLSLEFELGSLRVYMTHKKKDLPKDLNKYDLVVYGHSHQYSAKWIESDERKRTLLLNPGSCGPRRFHQPITMAVLTVGDEGWIVNQIDIQRALTKETGDIRRQIEIVIRETEKGQTIEAIARKHRIELSLVEQIARLYVTHPGVTVDGLMTKMGL